MIHRGERRTDPDADTARDMAIDQRAAEVEAGLAAALLRVAALEGAIRGLLLSADASWESGNQGHDWAEACDAARTVLLNKPKG